MSAFQLPAELILNYRAQLLPPKVFRVWVNLMAIACHRPIPDVKTTAWILQMRPSSLIKAIDCLLREGLLELDSEANIFPSAEFARPIREPIEDYVRDEVLSAGCCAECGGSIDLTVDHIRPVAAWGSNDKSNLACLCMPCNLRKGARVPKGADTWTRS